MKMALLTYPSEKLRKKSTKVVDFSEIRPIISYMRTIMEKEDGVAIAAPQVGILKRFFLLESGEVVVNPSWEPAEKNSFIVTVQEGCLSFPGLVVDKQRYYAINVKYRNISGCSVTVTLSGFDAQVFQHETEHLEGILLIDNIKA